MKLLWNKFFLACCALISPAVHAACTLDVGGEFGGVAPITFNIPSQVLSISADLPADTSTPFASFRTTTAGNYVTYINCTPNVDPYGGSVYNLPIQGVNNIYATQIPGIGVKVAWNNSVAPRYMPFRNHVPDIYGRLSIDYRSYWIIEFYKTSETLRITPNMVNTVLSGGEIGYFWVLTDSIANYGQKLVTGRIDIVSTPACTFSNSKSIDFNTVSQQTITTGVERPLYFDMNCRTDYSTYSVTASVFATSRTPDGKYISVTDAGGSSDTMKIKITDSNDREISVDGRTTRQVTSFNNIPAEFKWKATLLSSGTANTRPTAGRFNARAEIILQVK
ncbi:fimbrial protein [Erwinia sorbitola]|uniref:Fimbrial protein n=1 Tax=Erwinia sorbitola TaxID=2681984 RepID=A0A6I6E7S2_9GAMM|nr:fimbrial protein [Erwinia sorbitola]MTD28137.1 fimbrial protein [Erwinia sorbitola]QGU85827.1 fimbrial protein [Erwinia sorbitola]